MLQTLVAGRTVDRCETCNGCWFDSSELSAAIDATNATPNSSNCHTVARIAINCPRCKITVASSIYAHDSGIPINRCSRCHGVWLQKGQLQQLANYQVGSPRLNALADSMATDYARENRWRQFAELAKSRTLSSIVAALILLIVFVFTGRIELVLRLFACLIFPIACIWFPDAMGNRTGISLGLARPRITEKSPGIAVAIGGWILLATVVFVIIYQLT